ncbi:MAG: type II secretion system protein [bacterium]
MNKNQKGFTLIELLVVIAIIGILSTLAVISLNNARTKAQDAKIVSDVKSVQTALELFRNDWSTYPASNGGFLPTSISTGTKGTSDYVAYMAQTPKYGGGNYVYHATTSLANPELISYDIPFTLNGKTGELNTGAHTAAPGEISN